jgi:6-pyruvoyltetrahydropterin/6-carboxytetrahydropterin synthase
VQLTVRGEKQDAEVGWVVDFKVMKQKLRAELEKYDHKMLNEVLQVSPTAENIAKAIYANLKKELPVYKVTVWETENASVSYFE